MKNFIIAYLVTGMAHYAIMVRLAFLAEGQVGVIMRAGLMRAPLWLFLSVVLSWPIAAYRKVRRGRAGFKNVPTPWTVVNVLVSEPSIFLAVFTAQMLI